MASSPSAIWTKLMGSRALLSRGRQRGEQRFDAAQQGGGLADDMHKLVAALEAGDQGDVALRQPPFLRQELYKRIIGAPLGRRRGDRELQHRPALGRVHDSLDAISAPARGQP